MYLRKSQSQHCVSQITHWRQVSRRGRRHPEIYLRNRVHRFPDLVPRSRCTRTIAIYDNFRPSIGFIDPSDQHQYKGSGRNDNAIQDSLAFSLHGSSTSTPGEPLGPKTYFSFDASMFAIMLTTDVQGGAGRSLHFT